MPLPIRIALVGDHDATVTAHQAIPRALALAAETLAHPVQASWVPTDGVGAPKDLADFDGLWCVPASPYRSTEGALRAIRFAREEPRPFLGTCGGFQHAVLEYAQNVLGWDDAGHAEMTPNAERLAISALACSLVEVSDTIRLVPGSRLAQAYGRLEAREEYHCRFGLNPALAQELTAGRLRPVAHDEAGEIRAVELDGHPFFVATLFQPERAALLGDLPPIARSLVEAAVALRRRAS